MELVEQNQRSLAEFLLKTSFTLLSALAGLSALLGGLSSSLSLDAPWLTMLLVWLSAALLLATTYYCWKTLLLPQGSAKDAERAKVLGWARGAFSAALVSLIVSPVGVPLELLSHGPEITLETPGAEKGRVTVKQGDWTSFGVTLRNASAKTDVALTADAAGAEDLTVELGRDSFPLRRGEVAATRCVVRTKAGALPPRSLPVVIQASAGEEIVAARVVEVRVDPAADAAGKTADELQEPPAAAAGS